MVGKASKII